MNLKLGSLMPATTLDEPSMCYRQTKVKGDKICIKPQDETKSEKCISLKNNKEKVQNFLFQQEKNCQGLYLEYNDNDEKTQNVLNELFF